MTGRQRRPSVDVIVPSYNYADYLEQCVESLVSQDGVDVRVLVIDDGSIDHTPSVGRALAAADPRIEYRRHEKNKGHIATYNEGLAWASGDYLLLISADDLLLPGALARAAAAFERHSEASVVWGAQVVFSDQPVVPADAARRTGELCMAGPDFIHDVCVSGQNPVATPTVMIRTSAQREVGGYDPALPHTADLEMWLRLATCGANVELHAYQACKRQHQRNMQLAYVVASAGDVKERRQAFEAFFGRFGHTITSLEETRHQVARALSMELFWRGARLFDEGNVTAADEVLAAAAEIDPEVRRSPSWRKMTVKRMVGHRVWSVLQGFTGKRAERCA